MRIVSLLPSATEIVCALGLNKYLVGVSHECDFPEEVKNLPKVTKSLIPETASSKEIDLLVREKLKTNRALYSLDSKILEDLKPDLIVTQALCDVCAVAESEVQEIACKLLSAPQVINLEPQTLTQVYDSMVQVGIATKTKENAYEVVKGLQKRVEQVVTRSKLIKKKHRVVFLEWLDPPFCAGHWTPELITFAGGIELIGQAGKPSRTLTWNEIISANPELIVIAACGFDVARTLQDVPVLKALKAKFDLVKTRFFVIDGSQYFNRPGPRLVDSLEVLAHAIDPQVHPLPSHLQPALKVEL